MKLHQLRDFVTVADLGSFTRAAQKSLTDAGRALYAQAVTVLGAVAEMRDRVTAATDPFQGTVNVGAIPTVAPYLLPPLLQSFAEKLPRATVALHESLTEFTVRGGLEGELDVGVIASAPGHDSRVAEALFTEDLRLALPPKHPFLKKRSVGLEAVAGEPFVLMSEVHGLGELVVAFCKQQGCPPAVRCRSAQLLTVRELVALGHGVSLVPTMARAMTLQCGRGVGAFRTANRNPRCVPFSPPPSSCLLRSHHAIGRPQKRGLLVHGEPNPNGLGGNKR